MTQDASDRPDLPAAPDPTVDPDATVASGADPSAALPEGIPESIGPYRIHRRLGEGGMGEVYLAGQTEPIRRMVALKIIKPGMDTRRVVARFEIERQTLAMMDHPCIARVYDAGQTEQGRPYFVMEFVEGIPITRYCDARRLTTRQRLELIVQVCAGVQHAHQKAIIHRDLKPGNILVTEVDGKPVPKIIDFGVARATDQRESVGTMFTKAGHVVGTPSYMSPEQTDPDNADIDTRTDIYSLGVVLYELLVGKTPFDTDSTRGSGYDAILRIVREQDAPRPSVRLRQSAADTAEIAERHQTDAGKLARTLRGDLDWILMKALEKDRGRRYGTANALAMDIERYLKNEPVLASPPSAAYRVRKFVRRHRGGVLAGVAAVVVLAAFAVTTSLQNRVIARERDRAELETAKATAVNEFLSDMLVAVDPWASGDHDLTVAEAMDATRAGVDSVFAAQPLVAAELHATMGQAYLGLQKLTEAEEELRKGLDMQTAQLGPDHHELADTWLLLSRVHRYNMQPQEGIAAGREAVRIFDLNFPPASEAVLKGYENLVEVLIVDRRFEEADSLLGHADGLIAASEEDLRPHAASLTSLRARIATDADEDLAAADSLYLAAIDLLRASEPASPLLPIYLNNAAVNQMVMQDYDRARATYNESLTLLEERFGTDHPQYAVALENLGGIAFRLGEYGECLANLERVRDIRAAKMGDEHPTVLRTMLNMATVASMSGEPERAVSIYDDVLPRLVTVNGEMHVDTATTVRNLGLALMKAGRHAEAEAAMDRARPIYVELFGEGHHQLARLDGDRGHLRIRQERWSEAETLLSGAFAVFDETFGPTDPRSKQAAATLVEIYENLGRTAEAERYRGYGE